MTTALRLLVFVFLLGRSINFLHAFSDDDKNDDGSDIVVGEVMVRSVRFYIVKERNLDFPAMVSLSRPSTTLIAVIRFPVDGQMVGGGGFALLLP
jgi:hypothetical protein